MPNTIESTIAYKNLIEYRDTLKFVLEMRAYTFLTSTLAGLSNKRINVSSLRDFYSNDESTLERITTLLGYGSDAFLNCASLIDRDKIIKKSWDVLRYFCFETYPQECVKKTEAEVKRLEEACPDIRLLIIELMEFASNLDLSTEIGCKIKSAIAEYLKTVDYRQTPSVRDYLNQTCAVPEWYESYFIHNPSSTKEEGLKDANENFNALLSSILTLDNDNRLPVLKRSLESYYSKIEGVEINPDSLKRLLTENLTINCIDYIFVLLKRAGLLVDTYESALRETIINIIEKHLTSKTAGSESTDVTVTHDLWVLFRRSRLILSLKNTIEIFTDILGDVEGIDSIISGLLALLELSFPNYVAMFKEQLEIAKKSASKGAIELHPKDKKPI